MNFRDYIACLIARHYQGCIFLLGILFVVLGMLELCAGLQHMSEPTRVIREDFNGVTVRTWAGDMQIEGLERVVAPAVDAIRTSNKIEARQNHKTWPDLSADPDEY